MYGLIVPIACVVLAYRYAETENLSGVLWAVVSVVLWFGASWLLPGGILGAIAAQVAMLVGMRLLAFRRNSC